MPICGKGGLWHKESLESEAYIVVSVHKTVHRNDTNTIKFTLFFQQFYYNINSQITNNQYILIITTLIPIICVI